jgi:hypothetical protein
MGRACNTDEEKHNACRIVVGRPERTRPLGRPRRKWEANIKIYLGEIEWGDMDWIDLPEGWDYCGL